MAPGTGGRGLVTGIARRHLLRREDGIALLMALGIMVVFTISTIAMISYTRAGSRNSSISGSRLTALSLAESGIEAASSVINSAPNASLPSLLGCTTSGSSSALPCTDLSVTGPGGTAYFHGLYSQGSNTGTWTITAYGAVSNPTGGTSTLKKAVTATVLITGGGQSNNISVWNYVYATSPQGAGCEVDISGNNVTVDVPLFVTGDLCLEAGNAAIKENTVNGGQAVDVRVLGKLVYGDPNATVGTSAQPITSGLVSGGCTTSIGGTGHTCTPPGDKWYVRQTDTPITATTPTTDFPSWYLNASPGPKHVCDTTLTASPSLTATTNKFDSDSTMNGTTAEFDLTPVSSYNCVTSTGTLSWNATTKLLTINGTIFFDGPVTSTNTAAMYHGKATVYVNGTYNISVNNSSLRAGCPSSPAAPTHRCAFSNTSSEWVPNNDNLLIITNKLNATAINLSANNIEFQGGLMCPSSSTMDLQGNNIILEGAFICGKFIWGQNLTMMPLPTVSNLPPGAPVPPNAPATISPPVMTSG